MKIYQPMLFVGLGGTGCLIGTELERRLRDELCGPDGERLSQLSANQSLRPYQLPSCVQFVYADFSEGELNRLPYRRADDALQSAYSATSRATQALLPRFDSSPEIALRLRNALPGDLRAWLPGRDGEPCIAPLSDGAGQLPTVGRACFFEAVRTGLDPAEGPLQQAIKDIMRSGPEIAMVGGDLQSRSCDVFVAFSLSGGTGAGIFYDYLHLIAHQFDRDEDGLRIKIYPLVVMPSAFPEGQGGGRASELNAARGLVDLFRLVDSQNRPSGDEGYGDLRSGAYGTDTAVVYPSKRGRLRIPMRPSTVQTAFLFSGSLGLERRDLHRSVVSMVMSLIGTGPDQGRRGRDDDAQSFADSFVNEATERGTPAHTGIGRRGVSTGLVASVTVPSDALAELMAGHLLAAAVTRLEERARTDQSPGAALVQRMFVSSGLEQLWSRRPTDHDEPEPVRGAAAITQALAERRTELENGLGRLGRRLEALVPELAADFEPHRGAHDLLGAAERVDPFRLHRVVAGREAAADEVGRAGFRGMLQQRRAEPRQPAGVRNAFPQPRTLKNPIVGSRLSWTHEDVRASLGAQDEWYLWRSRVLWHQAWNQHAGRWTRTLQRFERDVSALRNAFLDFVHAEQDYFQQRTTELYRKHTAVSYLLPPQRDLDSFYAKLLRNMVESLGLPENADEADLLHAIVGPDLWQEAFTLARSGESAPRQAVVLVRKRIKLLVAQQFDASGDQDTRPLLPNLGVLLKALARDEDYLGEQEMQHYRSRIASLMPAGFVPQGNGMLKVLIVYPATEADQQVRNFLHNHLLLPRDSRSRPEFRPTPTQSITVVMFRTNMGLTDVPEVRHVLQVWAEAAARDDEEDYLAWRQRLDWHDDALVGTSDERIRILQALLCAAWNGQISVLEGLDESPRRVRVDLREMDGGAMVLQLDSPESGISSWGSVLRAYEAWTLRDEGRSSGEFCRRLLHTAPRVPDSAEDSPAPLYLKLAREIAPEQAVRLTRMIADGSPEVDTEWAVRLHRFWTTAFDAALDLRVSRRNRSGVSLRKLTAAWEQAAAGGQGPDQSSDRSDAAGPGADGRAGGRPDGDDHKDVDTYDDADFADGYGDAAGYGADDSDSGPDGYDVHEPEPPEQTGTADWAGRRLGRGAVIDGWAARGPGGRRRRPHGVDSEYEYDRGSGAEGGAAAEGGNGRLAAGQDLHGHEGDDNGDF